MIRLWPFGRRREQIQDEVLRWAVEVWPDEAFRLPTASPTWWVLRAEDHAWHVAVEESLRRLTECWSPEEIGTLAADAYFDPEPWQRQLASQPEQISVIVMVLAACLVRYPPPDLHARLEAKLRAIFANPDKAEAPRFQVRRDNWEFSIQPPPGLEGYLALLTLLEPTAETLDLIERLVTGQLDASSGDPRSDGIDPGTTSNWPVQLAPLISQAPDLIERLFQHDRLSYDVFARAAHHLPSGATRLLSNRAVHHAQWVKDGDKRRFFQAIRNYSARLGWELAQSFSPHNSQLLKQLHGLRGNRFLVEAARHHAGHRLGRLVWHNYELSDKVESGIVHLATAAVAPASAEEQAEVAAELRAFPAKTLKALLPIAWRAHGAITEALDWQDTLPLIDQIIATAGLEHATVNERPDVRSSSDPQSGVLDVPAVRAALEQAGEQRAREILRLFRSAQIGAGNTVRLIEVLAGRERAWVEKGLAKRNQIAVKAYGLLPLERGLDEVAERYLYLRQFAREASQFGPQRQASERAAAQVALANLAQNAGFPDVTRLEWAMEARLGGAAAQPGQRWSIEGYEVELTLDGLRPALQAQRNGRVLKRVPQAVRKNPAYAELAETVTQLRDQASRLRASLEQMMTDGEELTPADIDGLRRLPLGQAILTSLVLVDRAGRLGLLVGDETALTTLTGECIPLDGPLRIAHPYDFFQAGTLGEWQREIVRRRIVQPFAQVFRELYVLTPVERAAGDYSTRFAGHLLDSATATRLFQARGWETEQGDIAVPKKRLPAAGLTAVFEFPDAGHFLAEVPVITSGEIWFESSHHVERARVPLEEVPPRLLSEVLRDADLVVSVAQRDGELRLSREGYQRRGELVETLLAELGLPNVTVDCHFARVVGQRASYRVHLGSGAIHIEPGNHLCIVPEGWNTPTRGLFLPFADDGDLQVSVIVSKVLLLAQDERITDPSILAQIANASPP